ncbi:hypothetical protein [Gayadomonas joobiniege]|uniref:hypothetical protein n=1 Tax=Gayadomonas joobiniege TaxID=1234606 RepID=UPI0004749C56|nr:hypothetical protein [Gayadomonas joobiniege]
MKSSFVILLSLWLLSACTSTNDLNDKTDPVALAHNAIMEISAFYYCENKRWPSSFEQIHEYNKKRKVMPDTNINWALLKKITTYINEPFYQLTSKVAFEPDTFVPTTRGIKTITSGQRIPICKGSDAELQGTYINM